MTDVIFVNPYPEGAYGINEGTIEPPLGIGYLAAIGEENGLSCRIIDANILGMKTESVFFEIQKDTPKIVGISANLFSYQAALKLADQIKKNISGIVVILGGAAPTTLALNVMNECGVDAVAVGEGEETFREIIHNYKGGKPLFESVSGVIYRKDGAVIQNKPREFIKDINAIPFPAYHLYPPFRLYKTRARKSPAAPILTSRGCAYECVYCSKDVFKNACRLRSPENVIKEVDMLVAKYGVRQIDILDDNFTVNKKRSEKILDLLIERDYDLWINLQTGIRTESLDGDMIEKMKKAKVWKLPIGVESGDPAVLKRIKKNLDLNKALEIARIAKKAGMKVYGFFMLGLPGDTPESMQKTIDFAVKMNPNIANFCITIPFPGTELYDMVKRNGRFLIDMDHGIDAGFFANKVFYEIENMEKGAILRYYKKAMRDFYLRPAKILELLAGIRSCGEFMWFLNTGFSVITGLWKKDKQ